MYAIGKSIGLTLSTGEFLHGEVVGGTEDSLTVEEPHADYFTVIQKAHIVFMQIDKEDFK